MEKDKPKDSPCGNLVPSAFSLPLLERKSAGNEVAPVAPR